MNRLRTLRHARGLSQAKLAALADVHPATVYQAESGTRAVSAATLRKLAKALGVAPSFLLEPNTTVRDVPFIREGLTIARRHRGYSQDELAERSGITQATISRLENGVHPNAEAETLRRLAAALEVPADALGLELRALERAT